jgi:nitrilase
MIVDPWGQILTELESGNGIAMAELDTRLPAELRRQFPVLEHRRVT